VGLEPPRGTPLENTAINVVSRSGTTAETLANFLVVREALESAGVDWTERTIVTTGKSGPLRNLADRHDLPSLNVPDGVPGRFSALSAVGMVAAAVCGHDLEALLAGAAAERETLTGRSLTVRPTPTARRPTRQRRARCRRKRDHALRGVPRDVRGVVRTAVGREPGKDDLGQTPVRALGVTDQHSQLQLYRAGPRDKLVTFVTTRESEDRPIPDTDVEELAYLGDATLGELLEAEFEATEASLAAAGRPNVRVELERVDEYELGGLLYGMEAACVLAGELYGVNTFEQPAVEWAKKATRGLLGGGDFEEADAVAEKTELRIER